MNYQAPTGATSCSSAKNMPLLTELFRLAVAILQRCRADGALTGNGRFTATIFRGAADGWWPSAGTSSAPRPRRGCLRTEISAPAIRRGRRKRPRWLYGRGEICQPRRGGIVVEKHPYELSSSVRSDIVFVGQEYAAPDGACSPGGCDSTKMPRRWRFDRKWEIHGDNFSRCGRWLVAVRKDFQRAKATSRVSANRNFSAGDSTWPPQKTTLAL